MAGAVVAVGGFASPAATDGATVTARRKVAPARHVRARQARPLLAGVPLPLHRLLPGMVDQMALVLPTAVGRGGGGQGAAVTHGPPLAPQGATRRRRVVVALLRGGPGHLETQGHAHRVHLVVAWPGAWEHEPPHPHDTTDWRRRFDNKTGPCG